MFITTKEEIARIDSLSDRMLERGVEADLVGKISTLARTDQGTYDLMVLWAAEWDDNERDEILRDMQKSLDDYAATNAPSDCSLSPIQAAIRAQEDCAGEQSGPGWAGDVYGACPVQGEGTVEGRSFYFRARHGHWSFEISGAPWKPDDGLWDSRELPVTWYDNLQYSKNGLDPDDGWMKHSEAWRIIRENIEEFRTQNRIKTPRMKLPSTTVFATSSVDGFVNSLIYAKLLTSLDDAVARWHDRDAPTGVPLYEYLGFTQDEYNRWAVDQGALLDVLSARPRAKEFNLNVTTPLEEYDNMRIRYAELRKTDRRDMQAESKVSADESLLKSYRELCDRANADELELAGCRELISAARRLLDRRP